VLSALGFLTVFGGARTPDRTTFLFFPVVGALIGAALAVLAYRRWGRMEEAMRNNRELPFSGVMLVMTVGVAAAAFILAVLLLAAR